MAIQTISSMNIGIALTCSNQLNGYYHDWLGMDKHDQMWWFQGATMIGAVIGGFIMEPLLKFFRGRRRALLWEGLVTVTAAGC